MSPDPRWRLFAYGVRGKVRRYQLAYLISYKDGYNLRITDTKNERKDAMNFTSFKLRIDPALHQELKLVSRLTRKSMNQLLVDAIQKELPEVRKNLERDLGRTLEQLHAYAERDTDFTRAIEAFAAAEAQYEDPLEGEILEEGGIASS